MAIFYNTTHLNIRLMYNGRDFTFLPFSTQAAHIKKDSMSLADCDIRISYKSYGVDVNYEWNIKFLPFIVFKVQSGLVNGEYKSFYSEVGPNYRCAFKNVIKKYNKSSIDLITVHYAFGTELMIYHDYTCRFTALQPVYNKMIAARVEEWLEPLFTEYSKSVEDVYISYTSLEEEFMHKFESMQESGIDMDELMELSDSLLSKHTGEENNLIFEKILDCYLGEDYYADDICNLVNKYAMDKYRELYYTKMFHIKIKKIVKDEEDEREEDGNI